MELGTSLVVRWLRLQAPNAGALGLIPGQRTRSHMLKLKIPCAKINNQLIKKKKKKKKVELNTIGSSREGHSRREEQQDKGMEVGKQKSALAEL